MDDFEKEYFKKITKIAADFADRRNELAKSRIKMFVASIYRQLVELNKSFDAILSGGNSGLFMTKITKMTYDYLSIKAPIILNLPISRFKDDNATINNNSYLIPQVKEGLKDITEVNSVLFVDDEIMRALTARACFKLILKSFPNTKYFNATIIAENHFFEWHYYLPQVSINFFAYSPLIQGLNGNIGYFIPKDLYRELSKVLTDVKSYNHAMTIVIGEAIKQQDQDGHPYFDFTIEQNLTNSIADYTNKKSLLINELQQLVKEGVEKYKNGEIKFRF